MTRDFRQVDIETTKVADPFYAGLDLYTPNRDLKGWRALAQRWAFRLLRRWGAMPKERPMIIERHATPVDDPKGDICRWIEARRENFMRDAWHGDAGSILVGLDVYHEIMGGPGVTEGWVTLEFDPRVGYRNQGVKVLGLDLHVIERMEGILVLPGRIDVDARYHRPSYDLADLQARAS